MKKLSFLFLVVLLIGCGGGGGGGSTGDGSPPTASGFTSADFAGKEVYYSDGEGYMLTVFSSDGTFQYSPWVSSGKPFLDPQKYSWHVTNGELILRDPVSGDSTRNVLLRIDAVNRIYYIHQYYSDGSEFDAVLFYDQGTGLNQVQAYVGTPSAGTAPASTTLAATAVGATTATLNGIVRPNGLATTGWAEWGTDPAFASFVTTPTQTVGSGSISIPVSFVLTGLSPGVTYYYRIAASNSSGTSKGTIGSFTAVKGLGLVGLDDTSSTTAPLLTVTYTRPATPGTITVQILSDLVSDGDIAFDNVLSSFTVTTGSSSVLFGIDSLNINLPEFRAFLTFPLDGNTGQPIVPSDAFIVSATVEVFVNLLDFASTVPTFLDLVQYPFRGLTAVDFDSAVLARRPVFDFFFSDVGNFIQIEVTSLMQAAQVPPALVDFQLRFSRDMSVPPLAPSSPSAGAGRTIVAPPRAMEGKVPNRHPAMAQPLSPADLAARRR